MPLRAELDHLVYATPDLAATADALAADDVELVDGGPHIGAGTRNRLTGLAAADGPARYLEVIGPDPEQPEPEQPRPFGIDTLGAARLATWAVRVTDLDGARDAVRAAGHEPGPVWSMSRRRPDGELLAWRLAFPPDDAGGVLPFLLDWGETRHPSTTLPPGAQLAELALEHPDPDRVRHVLTVLGVLDQVTVRTRQVPALAARLATPFGEYVLR